MILLGCNNISISFGTRQILKDVTFSVQDTDKIGIVGVNGAGKSTLFKIITSGYIPDSGEIYLAKGCKIGYLAQNSELESSNTILEEVLTAFSHLIRMEERIKELEKLISTEKDEEKLSSYMKEYSNLSDNFSRNGGYEYNSRSRGILKGLGFREEEFELKVSSLSGGQKTRLAMAKLLTEEPDLLLLDEPTNHLDIDAVEWLEDFLISYKKGVMIISHDRFFLDRITNKTLEIENCECKLYNGNYTKFVQQKEQDREIQQKHYELQQKEIARMEAFIEQQRRWNRERNIIAAESRMKAIERMEKVDKPNDLPEKIKIDFKVTIQSGNEVLTVDKLSKEYPGRPLFNNLSFKVMKRERVFILGPNGCGKSTLLKILTGKIKDYSGSFKFGHNTTEAYYDQEHSDLSLNNTVIDELIEVSDNLSLTEIRNALAMFLFKGDDVFKEIGTLSGGEKGRISLLKIMLSGANVLILDEPTNHLDISSREVLERALLDYEGTLVIVSHDRYFIDKIATRIIELGNDFYIDYKGNYSEFKQYKARLAPELKTASVTEKVSAAKLSHIATKEEKARRRKLEKQYAETENEIQRLESSIENIKAEMQSEDILSDHVKLNELHNKQLEMEKRLEELYELWETLAMQIEA
ncbi:ABC-F family ATP-binding cassette domain-containing protein [Acetivibrio clariflavus]|uniref:ATPase component of ABC transporters with duplicated ATPase domain n=1 Tax=Acetivibrio clariflavus (strain DSM 19732 / NBRC 101661 / EBR45) TaxID=720554 RepID=G8LT47_ACECE|nr:ABC-F type ribosomal protection protein [Acetivibrio clariflavus]AEV67251.1 ATPase component of ABC transporters with duplicated ATPase domain [Acetivibrio clariflavus DSM 19732]